MLPLSAVATSVKLSILAQDAIYSDNGGRFTTLIFKRMGLI